MYPVFIDSCCGCCGILHEPESAWIAILVFISTLIAEFTILRLNLMYPSRRVTAQCVSSSKLVPGYPRLHLVYPEQQLKRLYLEHVREPRQGSLFDIV